MRRLEWGLAVLVCIGLAGVYVVPVDLVWWQGMTGVCLGLFVVIALRSGTR